MYLVAQKLMRYDDSMYLVHRALSGHFIKVSSRLFPNNFFSIYDNLTSEHVPGQLKYDLCMTEQVSGPQGTIIAGRHMVMIPNCMQAHGAHGSAWLLEHSGTFYIYS